MTKYIFVDVEATRTTPYSGVMTEFGAVEYKSEQSFHGKLWDATPDPKIPAIPVVTPNSKHYDELKIMLKFIKWLESWNDRVVFVSDNPAYDYQWINYYFDKHGFVNPFGHSARRIGDFYAGLTKDFGNTSHWKSFRVTKHDHNPVNDAQGNVEAVKALVEKFVVKGLK